jgi:hypothetical protein
MIRRAGPPVLGTYLRTYVQVPHALPLTGSNGDVSTLGLLPSPNLFVFLCFSKGKVAQAPPSCLAVVPHPLFRLLPSVPVLGPLTAQTIFSVPLGVPLVRLVPLACGAFVLNTSSLHPACQTSQPRVTRSTCNF